MALTVTSAQDVVRCSLCDNSADYQCKLCQVKLCCDCTSKHLSDKSVKHEVAEFTTQRNLDKMVSECASHDKYVCEIYCKDCSISICTKCVTGDHRRHNFISLEDFLEERKVEVLNEIQEIESTVLSEFKKQKSGIEEQEYENTIEAIFAHEDEVCSAVREAGSKLREQLTQIRKDNLEIANKNALEEKEIVNIIEETRALLTKNDPKDILEFKGVKCQVNSSSVLVNKRLPVFQIKHLEEGEIQSMFGVLVNNEDENEVIGGENLKKQAWFHGYIPREEAEQLMKRNGDFLVRETMNTTDQDRYVISSFRNGPVHFKVFPGTIVTRVGRRATLIDLVNHLVTSGEPLSNSNPSILKFPVDRNQHQLDFDQIKLGPKIENMQRGHGLYNGTFANKAILVSSDEEKETRLFKNVNLLRFFDHPNIVRLQGYSALWKPVLLLMENMSGGPLLTYLRGNGTSLTTRKRTEMCRDVARGMAYLHKDKFIHRDVAARNCLVSDGGVVKIYDFWMTEKGEAYQIQDKIGRQIPIKWTAPEALLSGSYTLSSDVWSFGILMWETFSSGLLPYPGLSNKETTEQVPKGYRMKSPDDTPKSCYSLMLKCWEENPTKRGNFGEIVKKLQTIVQKTK